MASDLINPLFWQALGRGLGKQKLKYRLRLTARELHRVGRNGLVSYHRKPQVKNVERSIDRAKYWKSTMHRFIDHLIEGKTAEDFFNDLIK